VGQQRGVPVGRRGHSSTASASTRSRSAA
jgi:hypothetical protein